MSLIVSEKYRWNEETGHIINIKDGCRYPDTSYEAKVNVYEDRVRSWFLNLAIEQVSKGQSPADYVALSIALAYIEGVEQYRQGSMTPRSKSAEWFKKSVERIFPTATTETIERLWTEARCGLFHCGFTNGLTYLSHGNPNALEIKGNRLNINPEKFVRAVDDDFNMYIAELRLNPDGELGKHFKMFWDDQWEKT
jgi:hypothetical protein